MKELTYTERFQVRAHDIGADGNLTVINLVRAMQRASLDHAVRLKTSIWDMMDEQLSWVVLRNELKQLVPLKKGEFFTVVTYPSGFDKFFAFRDFLVFNDNKRLVATSCTTWALIHTGTRSIQKIPHEILKIGAPKDLKFLKHPEKVVFNLDDLKKIDVRKIRRYDIDWNNHVNNRVLIQYLIESTLGGVQDSFIQSFNVIFKNEAVMDDEIHVLAYRSEKKIFSLLKRKSDGKEIARSEITLKELAET